MLRALLMFCMSTVSLWTGAASAGEAGEKDRRQLMDRIEQFNSAIREGDPKKYADVFADDFIFTWARNGQIFSKEAILPNVKPTPDYNPVVDEVLVRQFGDSAVVNYRVRQKPEDAGNRVTFSYSRIAGAWKVIAAHGTPIVLPASDKPDGAERTEG